jgi:phosphatidylglycerophosphate synthase
MKKYYPSMVTGLGLALGIGGCLTYSIPLLMASLICDVLDGELARRLGVASRAGGMFDYLSDVALATLALVMMGQWYSLPLLLGWNALACLLEMRISGRAVIFFAFVIWIVGGWV